MPRCARSEVCTSASELELQTQGDSSLMSNIVWLGVVICDHTINLSCGRIRCCFLWLNHNFDLPPEVWCCFYGDAINLSLCWDVVLVKT
jgi:hypothetical protein